MQMREKKKKAHVDIGAPIRVVQSHAERSNEATKYIPYSKMSDYERNNWYLASKRSRRFRIKKT